MSTESKESPREYTRDEVQKMFLDHVNTLIDYCEKDLPPETSTRGRLEQLAFSIMSTLDGCSVALPGFIVIPNPHPDDKSFHEQQGENWFPPFPEDELNALDKFEFCDIGGSLHERILKR